MSHADDEGRLPVRGERTSSERPHGGEMCVGGRSGRNQDEWTSCFPGLGQ